MGHDKHYKRIAKHDPTPPPLTPHPTSIIVQQQRNNKHRHWEIAQSPDYAKPKRNRTEARTPKQNQQRLPQKDEIQKKIAFAEQLLLLICLQAIIVQQQRNNKHRHWEIAQSPDYAKPKRNRTEARTPKQNQQRLPQKDEIQKKIAFAEQLLLLVCLQAN